MKLRIIIILLLVGIALVVWNRSAAEDLSEFSYSGEGDGVSPAFTVDGPWTLDWSTRSEFVSTSGVTIRLVDGKSGELIGRIAELDGVGRGFRVFDEAGTYKIALSGRNFEWQLEVRQISEEQADDLKRRTQFGPSIAESSRRISRSVPEGSFTEWRPDGDERLYLLKDGVIVWRISFATPCPGLKAATSISFVTPTKDGFDTYDSVLLEDGTRCYFDLAVPESV